MLVPFAYIQINGNGKHFPNEYVCCTCQMAASELDKIEHAAYCIVEQETTELRLRREKAETAVDAAFERNSV